MPVTRRRTILFSTLAALASTSAAWAQSDPVFARLDSNHDGRISLSEHGAAEKATFKRMDADHDGKLSAQEMASVHQAMTQVEIAAENGAALTLPRNARAGTKAPAASAEDAAVAQALFDRLDVNHDGTVSTAEMQAAHSRPPPAQTRAAAGLGMAAVLDANHDGLVSAAEHASIARARFARMDANGDGFVSSQEWATAHSAKPPTTPKTSKTP
jgi:Ca2+-binding EF-hand superfamily protein